MLNLESNLAYIVAGNDAVFSRGRGIVDYALGCPPRRGRNSHLIVSVFKLVSVSKIIAVKPNFIIFIKNL